MDLQTTKLELIKFIADIESERFIEQLKSFLYREAKVGSNGATPSNNLQEPEPEWITQAREPMPEQLDLEKYKAEQGYDPRKLDNFFNTRDRSVWQGENFQELVELMKSDK